MRDIHFASYVDTIATQVRFPPPAFRLSKLEAFVGAMVAFFDASTSTARRGVMVRAALQGIAL
jgi:hypothetical protein